MKLRGNPSPVEGGAGVADHRVQAIAATEAGALFHARFEGLPHPSTRRLVPWRA